MTTKLHPAYQAIIDKSNEINMPTSYRTDLSIDRESIEKYSDKQFIWGVRECGTDLHFLGRWPDLAWFEAVTSNLRYFYWDGQKLSEVSRQEAHSILEKSVEGEKVQ